MNEGCSVYFLAKFDMLGNILFDTQCGWLIE